jgi:hypothetical protein
MRAGASGVGAQMDRLFTWILVLVLLVLAPVSVVSGFVGAWRWWRGDTRVPRAQLRGGRPRLRPGLWAPLLRIVLGSLVITWFVLIACALRHLDRKMPLRAASAARAADL